MSSTGQPVRLLEEYKPERLPRDALSSDLGELLWRDYKTQVEVEFPSPKTDNQWQLTNKGWVGYIPTTSGQGFELWPRIPLGNLFGMLEYAYRFKLAFLEGLTACQSLREFYERLAHVLAKRVLDRGRKGFYRAYLPETDQLPYIRGRLDVSRAVGRPWDVRLACHYEEHTADLEDNQLLAWTLSRVTRSGACTDRVLPTIRKAFWAVQSFATPLPFGASDCIGRAYNRLNEDYQPMHALCRFFLEHTGPAHESGDRTMLPFLVDMAGLFEAFVAEWLRAHLPRDFKLRAQEHVNIDSEGRLHFIPDLTICNELGTARYVLDTKYKASGQVDSADITQIIAYAYMKQCQEAVLVYPLGLDDSLDTRVKDIHIRALSFQLGGDLEEAGRQFLKDLFQAQSE